MSQADLSAFARLGGRTCFERVQKVVTNPLPVKGMPVWFHSDLSTGTVHETRHRLGRASPAAIHCDATPPAMKEMGLYGPIYPKHLDGYYVSKAGQFELTPLSGGRTLVTGTSWYQHGLWPAQYWRLWSDMVVHRIHRRVLEQIRALAEG